MLANAIGEVKILRNLDFKHIQYLREVYEDEQSIYQVFDDCEDANFENCLDQFLKLEEPSLAKIF